MKASLIIIVALLSYACGREDGEKGSRVAELRTSIENFDSELTQTETTARALTSDWSEIAEAYSSIAMRFREARSRYELARKQGDYAGSAWRTASEDWRHAEASWRFYQAVLKVAVAMERSRLDRASGRSISCDSVSTEAFRRSMKNEGISLNGKDIDHIVPRSLGGADHPLNYQVLDSSLNRSLGATWNVEKCAMAGRDRCADAVAASAKCGTYRGGF